MYYWILRKVTACNNPLDEIKKNAKKYYKDFKTDTSESSSTLLGTSPMTLYIMILMYHKLETRLKDSVRDRSIEWRNILIYD